MFGIGVPELLVLLVISLLNIGLGLWALMDAMSRPEAQWVAAGQSKGLWLAILTVILVVGCFSFGWIAAVLYFFIPRPALRRVGRSVGGR